MKELDPACNGLESTSYFIDTENGELDLVIQGSNLDKQSII